MKNIEMNKLYWYINNELYTYMILDKQFVNSINIIVIHGARNPHEKVITK